jgi:pyruvate-formate lyase
MTTTNELSRRKFLTMAASGVAVSMFLPSALRAAMHSSSALVKPINLNSNYFLRNPNDYLSQLKLFTDTYKKYSKISIGKREIECMRVQMPYFFCDIEKEDLFVGRRVRPAISFLPQGNGYGYCLEDELLKNLASDNQLTAENKKTANELLNYWTTENTQFKTREAYPQKMKEVLRTDDWGTPVIGAPLYRMSGTQIDFDKVIRLGISGLRNEISLYKTKNTTQESKELYAGMEGALDLFKDTAIYYADALKKEAETATSDRKKELLVMENVLRNISVNKPKTTREGIQLMFLYAMISGTLNYGRMDEYLGDLYVNDLKNGTIDEEETIRLLSSLWNLFDSLNYVWGARVIVGGKGRRNEANADKFALVAIEAVNRVRGIVPQFTVRFYKGQNPDLYNKSLDTIATGNPYPMLYNDDVNVPAVMKAFNVPYEEAVSYLPFGCGEYVLYHRSVGTPSGVINLLQALSVTLNKGINPITKQPMGIPASQLGNFDTFDNLFDAYKRNVELYVEQLAYQERFEYDMASKTAPFHFFSMAYDDCIKRGKAIYDGGVRYLSGTLESYGNTNTADSLTAIKKYVYDEKVFTLDQIVEMTKANFVGYEKERKMLLDAPKYGNDDNYADDIKVEVDRHICATTRDMNVKAKLHSYLIVIINNSANSNMGQVTIASADGRKGFTYMANANAPVGGADKNGVTAYLNSIVKPDPGLHAGSVQNMKFSKDMFNTYRKQTENLLQTYWEKGGTQCMIKIIK